MWTRFPKLWQRMFIYVLLLVMASHGLSLLVFKASIDKYEVRHFISSLATDIAGSLEFYDSSQLSALSDFFTVFPHDLWIENPDATPLAGTPIDGFDVDSRRKMDILRVPDSLVTIFETRGRQTRYLARVPLMLQEGPAYMFLLLGSRPPPALYGIFMQSAFAVLLLAVVLSLWLALKITTPLRQLRDEVLDIGNGNLKRRVTVRGSYEVTQVARAVNRLSASLSRNLDSMRLLLANLSHELRSPLARMNVSAVIVEEQLHPEDLDGQPLCLGEKERALALKHIRSLQSEMDHMTRLVVDSLLSSRLDMGEKDPLSQPVAISSLCSELCARHEDLMRSKHIDFEYYIQPGAWVIGDENLLFQMISNLLDNAFKYTADNGNVLFRLNEHEDTVTLSCENTHERFEEKVLARLFQPFYRAGLATGAGDGVGLGLSLVEKIVAHHDGSIRVENGAFGLLFTVTLPAASSPREKLPLASFE